MGNTDYIPGYGEEFDALQSNVFTTASTKASQWLIPSQVINDLSPLRQRWATAFAAFYFGFYKRNSVHSGTRPSPSLRTRRVKQSGTLYAPGLPRHYAPRKESRKISPMTRCTAPSPGRGSNAD